MNLGKSAEKKGIDHHGLMNELEENRIYYQHNRNKRTERLGLPFARRRIFSRSRVSSVLHLAPFAPSME
jgi:hypothetical protein